MDTFVSSTIEMFESQKLIKFFDIGILHRLEKAAARRF